MNRRALIKSASAALLAFGFDGCATSRIARKISTFPADARSPLKLSLVEASWDRVIRTTVGLRPHRDSGFVLRAEKLDEKLLVHNYGHGGSGMSLSWGTGYMAAETAAQHEQRLAAVIGCGVTGLTTARQLQRRGFDVTIYAMSVPPATTSNMSLAGFTPTSGLIENARRTPEWTEQFRRAAQIAYRQLQLLAGPYYGVSWIYSLNLTMNQKRGLRKRATCFPLNCGPGVSGSNRASILFPRNTRFAGRSFASSRRSISMRSFGTSSLLEAGSLFESSIHHAISCLCRNRSSSIAQDSARECYWGTKSWYR